MTELGAFATGMQVWQRVLGAVAPEARLSTFEHAAAEFAGFVSRGLDRAAAADALFELATRAGMLIEPAAADVIQEIITRYFEEIEQVPDEMEEPPGPNGRDEHKLAALPTFDVGKLQGVEPPPRRWCVRDRIPMRNVTLLSGDGATGKTTIALQLSVRVAAEQPDWLGAIIDEPGRVLFVTAEEELDEMHYRLDMIVRRYGLEFSNVADRLHLICRAGEDCVLGQPNLRNGMLVTTEQYARLRLTVEQFRPKLLIMESSADLYAGNESDRSMVRQFIRVMRSLCLQYDCAIVLISHPSMSGLGSGTGTAGSTQWQNSVRSRIYFTREKTKKKNGNGHSEDEDEEPKDDDIRVLKVMKLNYAKQGEEVRVKYDQGVFVVEGQQVDPLKESLRDQELDRTFMTLLRNYQSAGRQVSDKPSNSYAPALFAKETLAKAAKATPRLLAEAMRRLFAAQQILVVFEGPPSHRRSRIVPAKSTSEGASNASSNDLEGHVIEMDFSKRETEDEK